MNDRDDLSPKTSLPIAIFVSNILPSPVSGRWDVEI